MLSFSYSTEKPHQTKLYQTLATLGVLMSQHLCSLRLSFTKAEGKRDQGTSNGDSCSDPIIFSEITIVQRRRSGVTIAIWHAYILLTSRCGTIIIITLSKEDSVTTSSYFRSHTCCFEMCENYMLLLMRTTPEITHLKASIRPIQQIWT